MMPVRVFKASGRNQNPQMRQKGDFTMTKATIKKAAKAAGVDLSLIKITKIGGIYGLEDADLPTDLAKRNVEYKGVGQLPEVEKRISQYNRAVKKLVKAIGGEYYGFKTGYGARHYTFGSMTAGERLAAANID